MRTMETLKYVENNDFRFFKKHFWKAFKIILIPGMEQIPAATFRASNSETTTENSSTGHGFARRYCCANKADASYGTWIK
jgi:hypothetical protein